MNSELGGVTLGWRLTNTAEDKLFAAFEGTALHTRVLERFEEHGVPVRRLDPGRKNSAEKRGHQRARDLKVRRSPELRANRENPGVHCTSGRAGPRGHPVRERWLSAWPQNAPDPEGTPVAAPIGVSRSSTSVSRTRHQPRVCRNVIACSIIEQTWALKPAVCLCADLDGRRWVLLMAYPE